MLTAFEERKTNDLYVQQNLYTTTTTTTTTINRGFTPNGINNELEEFTKRVQGVRQNYKVKFDKVWLGLLKVVMFVKV